MQMKMAMVLLAAVLAVAACADQGKPAVGQCEPGVNGLSQTLSPVPKVC